MGQPDQSMSGVSLSGATLVSVHESHALVMARLLVALLMMFLNSLYSTLSDFAFESDKFWYYRPLREFHYLIAEKESHSSFLASSLAPLFFNQSERQLRKKAEEEAKIR